MTDADRLNYLAGQVHTLLTFAGAIIKAHENPLILKDQFLRLDQVALSQSEATTVQEAYLEGQRDMVKSLCALLPKEP